VQIVWVGGLRLVSGCWSLDSGFLIIDDSEIIKKILNHLGLLDMALKPPPSANMDHPPLEEPVAFIIYDESSSPGANDPASLLIPRHKCYYAPDASPDRLPDRC
jgi:hypothetical protein